MLLSEAIEEFLLSIHEEGTRKVYRYTLRKLLLYFGDVEIEEISVSGLRRWLREIGEPDERGRQLAPHTVHRDGRSCRRFFSWLVEEGHLAASPAARLSLPRLPQGEPPKAVSQADLELLLLAARERDNLRDEAILRLLAETGCRLGGLLSLRPDDIDLGRCLALVREKSKKARWVAFGQATAHVLRGYLVERPMYLKGGSMRDANCSRPDDQLFLGRQGNLTGSGVYRVVKMIALASGVEGRTNPHAHRHALARRLLEHGCDMGTVSQILGHSSIEVTHQYYARWTDSELLQRHRDFGGTLDEKRVQGARWPRRIGFDAGDEDDLHRGR